MSGPAGINHVALLTSDLDRAVTFYVDVLGASVMAQLDEGGLRHAMLDVGGGAGLHLFEQVGNPDAQGSPAMFGRGHVDHFALGMADAESFEAARARLVRAGASDGMVTDFGSVRSVSFTDPDRCEAEIALWQDGPTRTFEERIQVPYDGSPAGTP